VADGQGYYNGPEGQIDFAWKVQNLDRLGVKPDSDAPIG